MFNIDMFPCLNGKEGPKLHNLGSCFIATAATPGALGLMFAPQA